MVLGGWGISYERGTPVVLITCLLAVMPAEREFLIDNLLVRIHFIIDMIWLTGLARGLGV